MEVAQHSNPRSHPGFAAGEDRDPQRRYVTAGQSGIVDASGNWRVTFAWDGADAIDVDLEDYH